MRFGTLAFLVRWHLAQFACGAFGASVAAYQLLTFEEPKAPAFSAAVSSPAVDCFLPLMWLFLVVGLAMAANALSKANRQARG